MVPPMHILQKTFSLFFNFALQIGHLRYLNADSAHFGHKKYLGLFAMNFFSQPLQTIICSLTEPPLFSAPVPLCVSLVFLF